MDEEYFTAGFVTMTVHEPEPEDIRVVHLYDHEGRIIRSYSDQPVKRIGFDLRKRKRK